MPLKREAPEAERRHLTVMFCDLAGSTALSAKLDPEDLRDVVRQYQAVCAKVIARYDGHIAQYLGDGILVYFGYPTAHENDAQRAVRTGLGIVEAMDALNRDLQQGMGIRLEVRLGIHTGLVVVGEMGGGDRHEQLALGKTPNIAARLESLAQANTILISAETHRIIAGFFACDEVGTHFLKGVAEPMQIHRVLHENTARSRLEVAALSGFAPLVGREQEAGRLLKQWHHMKEGAGSVILLSGEAGIGKSRLVQVMKERVAEEPDAWLTEIRCSSDHQNAAFHPIIDLLERVVLAFEPEDTPRERLRKIEGFLVQYGLPLQENAPLLAALLSVSLGNSYLPPNIPPERQKHHTIAALVSVLLQRASRQPVLLVIEDLQWADLLTLEMIKLIIDKVPGTRVLALLTFRPDFPVPWQNFPHAVIREAAYEALLKSTRQLYHMRIGQVLAERFPHLAESRPELIAHHYTEARVFESAVPFWYRAAQRASRRSLPDEAIVYLNQGLALIRAMPESPDKMQQELEFLISLGSALVVTKGYAASEVERTYACARERAMQLGEHPHLYSAVQGLSTYYLIRGEFQSAQELAEQALRLAARVQDPALLVESHHVLGTALFHLGYLRAARSNLEEGIALYEIQQHRSMVSRFGHDSGILCLCYLARILWFQGYPAQAQRRSAEAMVLARELEHPFSLALALTFAALVSQVRMEIHVTRELAEEAIALCTAHGFTFCLAMAAVLHGWALTELDQKQAGIAQIEEGIKAWQATGAELFRPHLLALLAESYGKAGRLEEGLQVLAEAMTAAQKSGKRFYAAELNRLKGMLFMRTGRPTREVEQCFYQALEIARNQQAKSLELRAAVGLLSYQENNENAQQILQEAYHWFKEGFDTLDLQLASTLLARQDKTMGQDQSFAQTKPRLAHC